MSSIKHPGNHREYQVNSEETAPARSEGEASNHPHMGNQTYTSKFTECLVEGDPADRLEYSDTFQQERQRDKTSINSSEGPIEGPSVHRRNLSRINTIRESRTTRWTKFSTALHTPPGTPRPSSPSTAHQKASPLSNAPEQSPYPPWREPDEHWPLSEEAPSHKRPQSDKPQTPCNGTTSKAELDPFNDSAAISDEPSVATASPPGSSQRATPSASPTPLLPRNALDEVRHTASYMTTPHAEASSASGSGLARFSRDIRRRLPGLPSPRNKIPRHPGPEEAEGDEEGQELARWGSSGSEYSWRDGGRRLSRRPRNPGSREGWLTARQEATSRSGGGGNAVVGETRAEGSSSARLVSRVWWKIGPEGKGSADEADGLAGNAAGRELDGGSGVAAPEKDFVPDDGVSTRAIPPSSARGDSVKDGENATSDTAKAGKRKKMMRAFHFLVRPICRKKGQG